MCLPQHRLQRKCDSIRDMGKILTLYENFTEVLVFTYRNREVWIYTCLYLCVQQTSSLSGAVLTLCCINLLLFVRIL